jgi:undecaprenyl-diphosphatase
VTIFQSLLLGIVEGFTEFLPISSTAHLLIAQKALGIVLTENVTTFTIAIQAGSILAAAILYLRQFLSVRTSGALIIALIPTIFAGVWVYPFLKVLFANVFLIVPWTLVLGGILMLFAEHIYKKGGSVAERDLNLKEKCILGLAQTLALVPGVSRSGAMIVTGLFVKLPRQAITSFTFMLCCSRISQQMIFFQYHLLLGFWSLLL